MSWGEWLGLGISVVSVLGVWLTGIAWWHGRSTNKLIQSTSEGTQAILERMNQLAEERHRDLHRAVLGTSDKD